MDAVTLSQVLELLKRTGKNTDVVGTSTIFARLAQIANYVDTLESLIGTTGDAAGTGSIFARLAQIAGYVDQVEGFTDTLETLIGTANPTTGGTDTVFKFLKQINDYVDTVESTLGTVNTNTSNNATKIGTNTDAAGTTTLFARLAQIAEYVDTLEALIGANTDAAGTTTVFARLKQIAGYVDELEARIGPDTDTGATVFGKSNQILDRIGYHTGGGNPSGTIHEKLTDLKNTTTKAPTTRRFFANPPNNTKDTWQWLFDSGAGTKGKLKLYKMLCHFPSANDQIHIQVWIDGVLLSAFYATNYGTSNPGTFIYSHPEQFTRVLDRQLSNAEGVCAVAGSYADLEQNYISSLSEDAIVDISWNNRLEIKYMLNGSTPDFKQAMILYELM